MSDPIDRLTDFASSFEGGTMPASAAEVRRRGDRLRRRRQALVAAGAAAAVAAVAVPVLALTGGPAEDGIDPAGSPVSEANLLSDDDTVYSEGADWVTTDTYAGDGQSAFNVCARSSVSDLGATSAVRRDYELRGTGGEPAPGDVASGVVAEFASEAEAQAAYETIAGWVADCEQPLPDSDRYDFGGADPVAVPVPGEAQLLYSTYGPVAEEIDPYGDLSYIMETGLVRSGDRISVLTTTVVGQDYNFFVTPVERMLPIAADRLLNGAGATTVPTPVDQEP